MLGFLKILYNVLLVIHFKFLVLKTERSFVAVLSYMIITPLILLLNTSNSADIFYWTCTGLILDLYWSGNGGVYREFSGGTTHS
tara:strand:- start:137 stop:388 length:252 start_codon:yes stop_codon:yes gene_type:complete